MNSTSFPPTATSSPTSAQPKPWPKRSPPKLTTSTPSTPTTGPSSLRSSAASLPNGSPASRWSPPTPASGSRRACLRLQAQGLRLLKQGWIGSGGISGRTVCMILLLTRIGSWGGITCLGNILSLRGTLRRRICMHFTPVP